MSRSGIQRVPLETALQTRLKGLLTFAPLSGFVLRLRRGVGRTLVIAAVAVCTAVLRRIGQRGQPSAAGFRFDVLVTFLRRDIGTLWRLPVVDGREHLESLARTTFALRNLERRSESVADLRGSWFTPRVAAARGVMLYLHGGGFVYGSVNTHADLIARLALQSGLRTLAIDYRLAPEHPHPSGLEDVLSAYRWLLSKGIPPSEIAIAGDSAGANLAICAVGALRQRDERLPGAMLLLSPWVCLRSEAPSMARFERADTSSRQMLSACARLYADPAALDECSVSPLYGDLSRLPPTLLQVGGAEMLLDDCVSFAQRARDAGSDVTLEILPGMPHVPHVFADVAAPAARALSSAGAFVRRRVGPRVHST